MEFTDQPLDCFGEQILDIAVPTQLSFKQPLVFRIIKELSSRGYLPWTGSARAELCMDEALTNAMIHGNKMDPDKKIRVTICGDKDRWGVILEDQGHGFSEVDLPNPNDPESLLRESGRGILLIDDYVDTLRYNTAGNKLMITRQKQSEPDAVEALAAVSGLDDGDAPQSNDMATVTQDGAILIVELLPTRISDHNVDDLKEVATRLIAEEPNIVLDLSHVEYISSVGLAALISILKKVRAAKGQLVLTEMQPGVEDILNSAHLLKAFDHASNREQAISAMRAKL
jgi:serine/threonine-protein kinase RsbW